MIVAVSCTASGTGLTSFTIPIKGTIVGAYCSASQTTPAFCSVNGLQVPSSGVSGSDGALVCNFGINSLLIAPLNFPLVAYQVLQIDVKVAATFTFLIQR